MAPPTDTADTLLHELRDEVRQHYPSGRVIIGVDGVDGAGKTRFAEALARVFAEDGSAVFTASIDDFHRPRAERYARGRDSPQGFYLDSYDDGAFRRLLIEPFRSRSGPFRTAAFDLDRDEPVTAEAQDAPADAVLIVDGIFLHRPELRGIWNWSLWLHVPASLAAARLAERDGADPDPEAESNARYRGGQALYAREADPRTAASAIVDNSFPDAPVRIFGDFC
ncbi:uridine kinase [Microbacterium sp. P04]|uniref:uridine kinase n=1 Tax=Microbacterium sp. P04 TaxID=3366947 RepID=UPI003746A179